MGVMVKNKVARFFMDHGVLAVTNGMLDSFVMSEVYRVKVQTVQTIPFY